MVDRGWMTGRLALFLVLAASLSGCAWQATQFWLAGDEIKLRDSEAPLAATSDKPTLLIVAIDGIDRHLLYDMLRRGGLPEMARLLGGQTGDDFEHAYFDETLESTLPSSTGVSWATMITGRDPAETGVPGNEFFIRETGQFAAPVPVTVPTALPVFKIYTEGYANALLEVPTLYERLRAAEPGMRIWVGMHQYYAGADRLLLTDRTVMLDLFQSLFAGSFIDITPDSESLSAFKELDQEVIENMADLIDDGEAPADVITVYLPGLDHYAHITDDAPDVTRRKYLRDGLEPMLKRLRQTLAEAGALDNRYVVLTSDHGHTGVRADDTHSLSVDGQGEPPNVLEATGFTVRPFALDVDEATYFDSVLAYQGGMAFVYVADRSTCDTAGAPCDWRAPARRVDIDAAAEAFYQANRGRGSVPEMADALDMILVRTGPSAGATAPVFEVYTGRGETQPIDVFLAEHPRPSYVDLAGRIDDLTVGPHGDRAGDVILIAENGNTDDIDRRRYFASLYHAWHGSPSHRDSDIPLIVAHPGHSRDQLADDVQRVTRGRPEQRRIAEVIYQLREGAGACMHETGCD